MSQLVVPPSFPPSSSHPADESLITLLNLEELDPFLYRGFSVPGLPKFGRLFGGQTIAQSLVAASRTVSPKLAVHSFHSYFLRPGDDNIPILYSVESLRDGTSFSSRLVTATQRGQAIFTMSASYQQPENGLEHYDPMPTVPEPETLPSMSESLRKWADDSSLPERVRRGIRRSIEFPFPIEIRRITPGHIAQRLTPMPPTQLLWMKCSGKLCSDAQIHRAAIAYMSDYSLLETSLLPHGIHAYQHADYLQMASLDHSMYFHAPFEADQWLLVEMHSARASGGRGLASAKFYQNGRLVVSCVQEGLIRMRSEPGRPLGVGSKEEWEKKKKEIQSKKSGESADQKEQPIEEDRPVARSLVVKELQKERQERGKSASESSNREQKRRDMAPPNNFTILPAKL